MKSLHLFLKWYVLQTGFSLYSTRPVHKYPNIFFGYLESTVQINRSNNILSKFELCSHKKLLAEFLGRDFPHWTFV